MKTGMKLLKSIFFMAMRYSGIVWLIRVIMARKRVTILVYHNPDADTFQKQMHYCARHYSFISLEEVTRALNSGDWDEIPNYALVVTFDDGWKENLKLLGTFNSMGIRPSIFLCAGLVGSERHYWWTACEPPDVFKLKSVSNKERLLYLSDRYNFKEKKEYVGQRQALSLLEIGEIKCQVDFGSHTIFHPILPMCTREEQEHEIRGGNEMLKVVTGKFIRHFAYPNGDYNHESLDIVRSSDLAGARTLDVGWTSRTSDPFRLRSMFITDQSSVLKMASELVGIPQFLVNIYEGKLRRRREP